MAKAKREPTPEQVAQAAKMKELLEQRKATRVARDQAHARGEAVDGFHPHGSAGKQIRSGRRGDR